MSAPRFAPQGEDFLQIHRDHIVTTGMEIDELCTYADIADMHDLDHALEHFLREKLPGELQFLTGLEWLGTDIRQATITHVPHHALGSSVADH